jgi:hypothetical protein
MSVLSTEAGLSDVCCGSFLTLFLTCPPEAVNGRKTILSYVDCCNLFGCQPRLPPDFFFVSERFKKCILQMSE